MLLNGLPQAQFYINKIRSIKIMQFLRDSSVVSSNISKLNIVRFAFNFVPAHTLAKNEDVLLLQNFIRQFSRLFILTGAGVSTESGIPDYRSKGVGLYDRSPNRPVIYKDFVSYEHVRRRYWARNFVGWKRFSSMQPNDVHFSLANWEKAGILHWLVTQNVDRLHHKAGSERVAELHGTSYRVRCLDCDYTFSRLMLQEILEQLNPHFNAETLEVRPDGDVELSSALVDNFKIQSCYRCGGILKPDVIFFGDNVPKARVQEVHEKLKESDGVLVLGSSLEVYSGYRFLLAASEQSKPIGIVNIGHTRADHLASFRLNVRCGDVVPKVKIS